MNDGFYNMYGMRRRSVYNSYHKSATMLELSQLYSLSVKLHLTDERTDTIVVRLTFESVSPLLPMSRNASWPFLHVLSYQDVEIYVR